MSGTLKSFIYDITNPIPDEVVQIILSYLECIPTCGLFSTDHGIDYILISAKESIICFSGDHIYRWRYPYTTEEHILWFHEPIQFEPIRCGNKYIIKIPEYLFVMDENLQVLHSKKIATILQNPPRTVDESHFIYGSGIFNTDLVQINTKSLPPIDNIVWFDENKYAVQTATSMAVFNKGKKINETNDCISIGKMDTISGDSHLVVLDESDIITIYDANNNFKLIEQQLTKNHYGEYIAELTQRVYLFLDNFCYNYNLPTYSDDYYCTDTTPVDDTNIVVRDEKSNIFLCNTKTRTKNIIATECDRGTFVIINRRFMYKKSFTRSDKQIYTFYGPEYLT